MLNKIKISLLTSVLAMYALIGFGQEGIAADGRFSASLIKDSLSLSTGQYGFNSLTIINHSGNLLELGLKIDLPSGLSLLHPMPSYVSISEGHNSILAFRIKASSGLSAGRVYPVRITIEDPVTGSLIYKIFEVTMEAVTNWRGTLDESVIYSSDQDVLPEFSFRITNSGNRSELFDFSFDSKLRLTLPSKGNQLILKPGTDTLITVGVRSRNLEEINDEIAILIQSRNSQKVLHQKIFIVSNEFKAHEFQNYFMPMEFRWTGVNLAKGSSITQFLEANGALKLSNRRTLSFNTRFNIRDGSYNDLNSYYILNYNSPKLDLQLGTIQDFMYTQISGLGVRAGFRDDNKTYQILSVKNKFNDGSVTGLRQEISLSQKGKILTEALHNRNVETGVVSSFGLHTYALVFRDNSRLQIKAGYSGEKAAKIGVINKGFTGGYVFNTAKKHHSFRSNFQFSSKWFPGVNRGLNYQNHDLMLVFGPLQLGGFGNVMKRIPEIYNSDFSDSYSLTTNENKEYGGQLAFKMGYGKLLVKAGNTYQVQNSSSMIRDEGLNSNPSIEGQKVSLSYFLKNAITDQILTVHAINSRFMEGDSRGEKVVSYNAMLNGRFKSFGYTLRYEHGPSYYFDYLYQYKTGNQMKRQHYSVYWNSDDRKTLKARVSASYFDMSSYSSKNLNIRTDLEFDSPNKKWSFGLTSSMNLLKTAESPFVTLSLKKLIDLPLPFVKRYTNLKVRMFKDANNNNVWDKGEEPLRQANVKVNGNHLRSNNNGDIFMKNVEKGDYIIDFSPITNQKGWMPPKLLSDTISLKRNRELVVPFKTSKVISGKIVYEASNYSLMSTVKLSGLRIIATNVHGESFQTITNQEGLFFFNLVEGNYTIKMPTTVLDERMHFDRVLEEVKLDSENQPSLIFTVKEKGRKLNIKKAGSY